jgi:hypothetical protein
LAELQSWGYPIELFNSRRMREYAVVVYSKLYDDAIYDEASFLKECGARVVLDLCDNHFYNPNGLASLNKAGAQLKRMMALADELVASTAAMAEVMRAELAARRNITIIEDAVETEIRNVSSPFWDCWWQKSRLFGLLQRLKEGELHGRTPLVWFGIHGGPNAEYGILDLLKLRPLLEQMNRAHPLSLTVISNSRRKFDAAIKRWAFPTFYLSWHPETVLPALRAHQITIIPVSDNPFTRCKSNNRVAFSLNAGLAVVADTIPSYRDFAGVCFLSDWRAGLERYLADPALRRQHVEQGQAIVARQFSVERIARKWAELFNSLLVRKPALTESLTDTQPTAASGYKQTGSDGHQHLSGEDKHKATAKGDA